MVSKSKEKRIMKLYDSHCDFQTGECSSKEVRGMMTPEEKWKALKEFIKDQPDRGWVGYDHAMNVVWMKICDLEEK